jgi:hypothetical protein
MPRYVRNMALVAKIETTYGVDSTPTGSADAMLASSPRITPLQAHNVDRDLARPFFGGSEQLVGTRSVTCEFTVELAGSGAAGTAPAYGPLLRACAMAQTVTASTRVDYTPITTGQESVTIKWFDDGVLHTLTGARGTVTMALNSGERPELRFQFTGLFNALSAATPGSVSFSAFRTPLVVTDGNSGDLILGGTVSASGAPAVTSGTAYPSLGLEANVNNSVTFTPLLGGESVDITQRAVDLQMRLDATAAQEVSLMTSVLTAALSGVSLTHGTVGGNRVLLHFPTVQLYEPSKEELNGLRMIGYRGRAVPNPAGTGNDEFRLVVY